MAPKPQAPKNSWFSYAFQNFLKLKYTYKCLYLSNFILFFYSPKTFYNFLYIIYYLLSVMWPLLNYIKVKFTRNNKLINLYPKLFYYTILGSFIPIHTFSVLNLPKKIIDSNHKSFVNFFSGDINGNNKKHWIS